MQTKPKSLYADISPYADLTEVLICRLNLSPHMQT